MYHVRHRALDPRDGRWLQRDPIGYPGGWNLYQYANSDPFRFVDPSGLFWTEILGGLRFLGGAALSAGGVLASKTGVGALIGVPAAFYGADQMTAGFNQMYYGVPTQSFTEQGAAWLLEQAGVQAEAAAQLAAFVDAGLGIAAGGLLGARLGSAAASNAGAPRLGQVLADAHLKPPPFTGPPVQMFESLSLPAARAAGEGVESIASIAAKAPAATQTAAQAAQAVKMANSLMAESAALNALRRLGFKVLPSKLPGNKGIDGVAVLYNADGSLAKIVIVEAKYAKDGVFRLADTKTMGKQMSKEWIDANLGHMTRHGGDVANTAAVIGANASVVVRRGFVRDPWGLHRWINLP